MGKSRTHTTHQPGSGLQPLQPVTGPNWDRHAGAVGTYFQVGTRSIGSRRGIMHHMIELVNMAYARDPDLDDTILKGW